MGGLQNWGGVLAVLGTSLNIHQLCLTLEEELSGTCDTVAALNQQGTAYIPLVVRRCQPK